VLEPAAAGGDGRVLVQFDCNPALHHRVRPGRLLPVFVPPPTSPAPLTTTTTTSSSGSTTATTTTTTTITITTSSGSGSPTATTTSTSSSLTAVVCASTEDYRRLARSQVVKADRVLEIGSSTGECTAVLAQHAGSVVGVDNSQQLVREVGVDALAGVGWCGDLLFVLIADNSCLRLFFCPHHTTQPSTQPHTHNTRTHSNRRARATQACGLRWWMRWSHRRSWLHWGRGVGCALWISGAIDRYVVVRVRVRVCVCVFAMLSCLYVPTCSDRLSL